MKTIATWLLVVGIILWLCFTALGTLVVATFQVIKNLGSLLAGVIEGVVVFLFLVAVCAGIVHGLKVIAQDIAANFLMVLREFRVNLLMILKKWLESVRRYAVKSELRKVFRSTGMPDAEIDKRLETLF